MNSLGYISRALLILEALFIAFPSLFGLQMCIQNIASIIFDARNNPFSIDFIVYPIALTALTSGWYILIFVISGGYLRGKNIDIRWWIFTSLGVVISVLGVIILELNESSFCARNGLSNYWFWFFWGLGLGVLFVPTFLHWMLETFRQKRFVHSNGLNPIENLL